MSEALKLKPFEIELEIVSGPHIGQRFSFKDKESITIGRGPENDVILANDLRASRFHAELKFADGNYYVYNRASKNYILINGIKDEQALVANKANVTVGETEFKVIYPGMTQNSSLNKSNSASGVSAVNNVSTSAITFKSPLQPASTPKQSPLQVVNNASYTPPVTFQPASPPVAPNMAAGQMPQQPRVKRPKPPVKKSSNQIPMIIGAVIFIALIFIMTSKKDDEVKPRGNPIVTPILEDEVRLKNSEELLAKSREQLKSLDSRKMMARQFLVSGMREYRNGQYHKAIEYLASAFQSDPTLEEAAKYHMRAKQNLDKLIDHNFAEGKKYRESSNYRMCKASFQTVLFYIKNNMKHPRYIEAKQYYDECSSLDEVGRL